VAARVSSVIARDQAMKGMDFSRSRAGWLKFAIRSHDNQRGIRSPRANVSDVVYSPGLNRG
jgi:hypothetical protein